MSDGVTVIVDVPGGVTTCTDCMAVPPPAPQPAIMASIATHNNAAAITGVRAGPAMPAMRPAANLFPNKNTNNPIAANESSRIGPGRGERHGRVDIGRTSDAPPLVVMLTFNIAVAPLLT